MSLVMVDWETPNFRFVAYAVTEVVARDMLRQAWVTHIAQTGADPDYLDEFYEDVNVYEVEVPGVLRDGSPIAVGDVNGWDNQPSVQRIIDFATMHPNVGHPIGPDRPEFNMDEVCALLHYHLGVGAYVEYTGGGNATIYAGQSTRQYGEAGDSDEYPIYRYPCLGGPGWFTGPMGGARTTTMGTWHEFYVGPEEQDGGFDPLLGLADLGVTNTRQIAALIALYVTGTAGFDNVTAIGLDATGRGLTQNGA